MLTFIVNPAAGHGYAAKIVKEITSVLQEQHEPWEILYTEYPGHATELARVAAGKEGCKAVIAVGGDGTDYETACGLMDSDVPMGIIPAGTGNDFIKTIGIPRKPVDALRFILNGKPRKVDIGRMNDRMFLNVCGTGFDVTVLDYTLAAKKYARGILPYLIGLVRGIFHHKGVQVKLTVDGKTIEKDVLVCSIANGRFIGGGIPICPEATADDGLLDVVVVNNKPRWMIPFYLPGLMLGKILRFPFTSHVRCSEVSLVSPGMRLNVDGEVFSMDQADFAVLPGKLNLYW